MTIVDTHCHAGVNWFEPVELLLAQMNANGVDKAALIQHRGTFDNGYLFECAPALPGQVRGCGDGGFVERDGAGRPGAMG